MSGLTAPSACVAAAQVRQVEPSLPEAELVAALRGAQTIIPYAGGAALLTPALVKQLLPGLKVVQLMSAGFDHVDVNGLAELGVEVANNGGSNAIAVAEHAIALLLSFYRRMPEAIAHAHEGRWSAGSALPELPLRREINGKTIGIVGFGNVGRQIARRLSGFDVELLYHDPVELSPGRDRYAPIQ
jgi:lactate dehydrogenase-like 2-hydroxyacid dehydrogenase